LPPEVIPRLDDLVTEDDTPVDSILAEKQQRMFTEPLYSSWPGPGEGGRFLALANVGWFHTYGEPPLVPDGILGLGVAPAGDVRTKKGHSYYQWLMGKPPDVVMEIVSDKRGGEEDYKMRICARQGVLYYVIYDPNNLLEKGPLRVYELHAGKYRQIDPGWLPEVGLGLTLWDGQYEGVDTTWLRWCDKEGKVILTGAERAEEERRRAEEERQRAEEARQREEQERQRAEEERRRADEATEKLKRLMEQLRARGIEPEV
jgi:hypothetical protein